MNFSKVNSLVFSKSSVDESDMTCDGCDEECVKLSDPNWPQYIGGMDVDLVRGKASS